MMFLHIIIFLSVLIIKPFIYLLLSIIIDFVSNELEACLGVCLCRNEDYSEHFFVHSIIVHLLQPSYSFVTNLSKT